MACINRVYNHLIKCNTSLKTGSYREGINKFTTDIQLWNLGSSGSFTIATVYENIRLSLIKVESFTVTFTIELDSSPVYLNLQHILTLLLTQPRLLKKVE